MLPPVTPPRLHLPPPLPPLLRVLPAAALAPLALGLRVRARAPRALLPTLGLLVPVLALAPGQARLVPRVRTRAPRPRLLSLPLLPLLLHALRPLLPARRRLDLPVRRASHQSSCLSLCCTASVSLAHAYQPPHPNQSPTPVFVCAGAAAWVVIIGVKTALELAKAELQKLEEEFSRQ